MMIPQVLPIKVNDLLIGHSNNVYSISSLLMTLTNLINVACFRGGRDANINKRSL